MYRRDTNALISRMQTAHNRPMRVALVGCGFVADYYAETLRNYTDLEIAGVYDRRADRTRAFSEYHHLAAYASLDELLSDRRTELVINLTNPRSHYEVSRRCILAGKHVYSEKPLATEMALATELVDLARERGVHISAAPCSLLGETAQTIWRALRRERLGQVRLVYAEMDEGMVHRMPYRKWLSASGAPWPYEDEFELGTVIEHAGYVLSWLPAFFGPARAVCGFSSTINPEKLPGRRVASPDLAVAVISFDSGVTARVTCSLVADHDHSLRIFGDRRALRTRDTWMYSSPVSARGALSIRRRYVHLPWFRLRMAGTSRRYRYRGVQQMDFARGVHDLAEAVRDLRLPRLSAEYSLHVTELVLALNDAIVGGANYKMTTDCPIPDPMPWAV